MQLPDLGIGAVWQSPWSPCSDRDTPLSSPSLSPAGPPEGPTMQPCASGGRQCPAGDLPGTAGSASMQPRRWAGGALLCLSASCCHAGPALCSWISAHCWGCESLLSPGLVCLCRAVSRREGLMLCRKVEPTESSVIITIIFCRLYGWSRSLLLSIICLLSHRSLIYQLRAPPVICPASSNRSSAIIVSVSSIYLSFCLCLVSAFTSSRSAPSVRTTIHS